MDLKNIILRPEKPEDCRKMEELIREAFWDIYKPGCDEHLLAHRMRRSPGYLPEFSFIAEEGTRQLGGIYYTRINIRRKDGSAVVIPSFGPIAVLPGFQKQGIGGMLIRHTIPLVRNAGYDGIVIFGNPVYYSRFGFESGEKYGITDGEGNFCEALQILRFPTDADLAGRFEEGEEFHYTPEDAAEFDRNFPPRQKHALPTQIFLGIGEIRPVPESDFETVHEIVNDAAQTYRGTVSREELRSAIDDGVRFFGFYSNRYLVGVAGIQDKGEAELIRYACVRTVCRQTGISGKLLAFLKQQSAKPFLAGTWADALQEKFHDPEHV